MDLDTAMDTMNQEHLMHIISQLDSALTHLSSPSTSPSASPPQQPPVLVPSNPLYCTTIPPPVQKPVLPPIAATPEDTAATKEMLYSAAAMHKLVSIDADEVLPRRRNVRVSSEPQSVAARLRRERVSQRMHTLQRLVPGGARLDTASMLDEAIRYVKFLKSHVQSLEQAAAAMHRRVDNVAGAGDFYACPYYA